MNNKLSLGKVGKLLPLRNEFLGPFDDVFNDFADSFFRDFSPVSSLHTRRAYPKVDVKRLDNDLIFYAAVPGMTKEQLSVDVEDGVLTIHGESQLVLEESTDDCTKNIVGCSFINELKKSSFIRRFTLPTELHIDNIEMATAKLENGILEIRFSDVYKDEPEQPKQTSIIIE